MKPVSRALITAAVGISLLIAIAYGGELGAREARTLMAEALGLENEDDIRIKSISPGVGGQALVEVTVETAFRLVRDQEGNWVAADIRTGDRRWESIKLIREAITKEKILRTTADLRSLVTALEAFRRDRGFYVTADNGSALVDNLAPRYLNQIIRLDAWSNEYLYQGSADTYRLTSKGPDGVAGTDDDIVVENGRFIRGAAE